jgi:ankyrin repeat protein
MFGQAPPSLYDRQKDVVQLLLDHGANASEFDILWAAYLGRLDQVESLLRAKPMLLEGSAPDGFTPLHFAAKGSRENVIEFLLRKGATVDVYTAAALGDTDRVASLLSGEMATNTPVSGRWKWQPIHEAASAGSPQIVQLLLDHGADLHAFDPNQQTALHLAAERGHVEVLEVLLDRGANVDAQGMFWQSPLYEAAAAGHAGAVELLLDRGANVNGLNHVRPLVAAARNARLEVAKLLLKNRAEVNGRDWDDKTPLYWAAVRDDAPMAALLLAWGADVNAHPRSGRTALAYAKLWGSKEMAELLHQHGGRE